MSNFSNNTTLKTTWTNALFGVLLIALLSAAARFGTWYGVMWQGDPEIFWTEFAILSVWLLMFSLLLPVICYLIAYGRYKHLIAHHPLDPMGAKEGTYGRPSLVFGFLLLLLEVLALAVIAFAVYAHFKMDLNFDADRIAFVTLVSIYGGGTVLNLILYGIAIHFFKPNVK